MNRQRLYSHASNKLRSNEFFHFAHEDLRYRVPHITHYNRIEKFGGILSRRHECVAIVSNAGGRFWFCRPGFRLRNKFITNERVQLFGKREAWKNFYRFRFTRANRFPKNYKGELTWDKWGSEHQVNFLSDFKVAICMENVTEPYYFSEKFLNAARAGCVPIYHAHPTLRTGVLQGAFYVDPERYKFDPEATIHAALSMNIQEVQRNNRLWLQNDVVCQTSFDNVWSKLAAIFRDRIDGF